MDVSLIKIQEIVKDNETWHAAAHGVTKRWTWLSKSNIKSQSSSRLKEKDYTLGLLRRGLASVPKPPSCTKMSFMHLQSRRQPSMFMASADRLISTAVFQDRGPQNPPFKFKKEILERAPSQASVCSRPADHCQAGRWRHLEPATLEMTPRLCAVLGLAGQSCPTLCSPMDWLQPARLLGPWKFSRQEYQNGLPSPPPGNLPNPGVSHIAGGFFSIWATREAQECWSGKPIPPPEDLLDPGITPGSPALQGDSLPAEPQGKPTQESPKVNPAWRWGLSLTGQQQREERWAKSLLITTRKLGHEQTLSPWAKHRDNV